MAELLVEGPDALKLFSHLAINSFANFPVNRAKQFVPCSYDGHVIGDGILFHLEQDKLRLRRPRAGRQLDPVPRRDRRLRRRRRHATTARRRIPSGKAVTRSHYRYQIQGPNAKHVIEKLNGGPVPEIKFFNMDDDQHRRPQGARAASRHGRRAGPRDLGPVRRARRDPRRDRRGRQGIRPASGRRRAYASNTLESGWIPSPLPAIYTGDKLKAYRQWLPANSYEATGSLGGSFVSTTSRTTTSTPYELGYGPFVKFDHDFIGREALEKMAEQAAAPEGDLRVERRRRRSRCSRRCSTPGDALQVPRLAAHQLRVVVVRHGRARRQDRRLLDVLRLQLQRALVLSLGIVDADVEARQRGDAGLGRGRRRHEEADRRAPQADRSRASSSARFPTRRSFATPTRQGLQAGARVRSDPRDR